MCGAGPQGKSFRSWDKMLLLRPEADAGGAALPVMPRTTSPGAGTSTCEDPHVLRAEEIGIFAPALTLD